MKDNQKQKLEQIKKAVKELKQQLKNKLDVLNTIEKQHEQEIDEILTAIENALHEELL